MDLVDLLIDVSVDSRNEKRHTTFGHKALDAYYDDILDRYLREHEGQFLVRSALNVAVQQLATRSRVDRARERYLQIGSLDACDLSAALINSMPHTMVDWVPGFTGVTAADTADVLDHVRSQLPADGMAHQCRVSSEAWPAALAEIAPGSLGLACVFSDRITSELAPCVAEVRARIHAAGRAVVFEVLTGARRPTQFDSPDFTGRYILDGAGPVRTIAITVLPGFASAKAGEDSPRD